MNLENKIEEIKKMYESGMTQKKIAESFGCAQSYIGKLLKINNINLRPDKVIKYDRNYDFFKEINCEANVYFLGLLYADGCVYLSKKGYSIEISLQERDKHILEIFLSYILPKYKLKFQKRQLEHHQDKMRLKINSKTISEQLIKLGCVPNKSLILQFPTFIPNHLFHHFIRGYSDGDGSIYKENTGSKNFRWQLTSTYMFLEPIKEFIKNKFDIDARINLIHTKLDNNITSNLDVGGNCQVETMLDWLYKDATIFLNRKYDKYIQLKNRTNRRTPLKEETVLSTPPENPQP